MPGAAAAWVDCVQQWGSGTLSLQQVLQPAIDLADAGFPVAPLTAEFWSRGVPQLQRGPHGGEMMIDGRAPRAGEVFRNPNLAEYAS